MADTLKILLTASLNAGKSIGEINTAIAGIQQKVNKLKLNIDVSGDFTKNIQSFISAVEKIKKISSEQNKVVEQTQEVFKSLDGTVKTVTTTIAANGEQIKKTKVVHDENKKAMQDESLAAQKLTQSVEQQNKAELDSITVLRNKANAISGFNVKSSQGYTVTTKRLESDGQTLVNSSSITNYRKQREDELKEQDRLNKKSEAMDKAHYKALRTNQERTEAQDKQHVLALQQNAKRETDFAKQKADTISKINDMIRRFGSDDNVKGKLEDLKIKASTIKSVGDYRSAIGGIQSEIRQIGSEARTTGSHIDSLGNQFGIALSRLTTWGLATTAIYGTKRALESMISTIVEIDTQIVKLKRVMDADTNFETMLKGSIQIANELGQKVSDINKALIEAAQAGFKANDALDITKTAVIASNVSDMTPEESMSNMIAAMKAFNISAKESITIVDKLNQVDNDYSITTKNLAASVTHAGAAAKTYGVSLDQLVGYTTAIGEVTRESGAVIGNMEKSLFSRLFTSDSITALEDVKVAVQDINGENRKASEILSDLGTNWENYTSTQQQNLGVTIAGRNQLTRFLALMNNWDTAVKATETSLNSQGSAMRENSKFMESLQAKLNLLTTSWEQLAESVGGKGLTGIFSGTVETLTALTHGFAELTEATDGWNIKLPILAAGLYAVVKAFQAVRIAANGAKLSMGWIGVGLIAIDLLASSFLGAAKNAEINTQALVENANQTKSNADQLQGLIDKYNKLEPEAKNNADKQKELHDVLQQINDVAPQVIDNTNKYGDSLTLNKEKVSAYIESLRAMNKEQLGQAKLANDIQLNKVTTELETANNKLKTFGDDVNKKFESLNVFQNLFQAKTVDKGLENYRKMISDLQKQQSNALSNNDSVGFGKINNQITDLQDKFRQFSELTKSSQKEMAEYSETVNNRNGLEQEKKALDELGKSISDQIEGKQNLAKASAASQANFDEETGEVIKAAGFQEVLSEKYAATVKNIQPLNDALDKLAQGHSLTSSEITSLLQQYPDLFNAFTIENGQLQINTQALEEKRDAEIAGMQTAIQSQREQVAAQEKALVAKLQAYGVEIDAINSLSEAKAALATAESSLTSSFNPNGSEMEQVGKLQELAQIEKQTLAVAKAKEAINVLQTAAQNGFKFENSLNTPNTKEKSESQATLHTLTDFSKEEISNINNVIAARDNNIKSLEKQLETAKKTGEYNKVLEATNSILEAQKGKIDDINTANNNLKTSADNVRSTYQSLSDKFSQDDVGFDAWFNNDASASTTFIQAIQQIDKEMQNIEGNGQNLTDNQTSQIKALENQKTLYQQIFSQMQGIKQAWSANSEEIQKTSDAISGLSADIDKQLKDEFHSIMDISEKSIDSLISSLKNKLSAKEIFDPTELKSSIDAIMGSLDTLDNISPSGYTPIDTSDVARNKLKEYKNDIDQIAGKITNLTNVTYTNSSQLKDVIDKQIDYATQLKDKLSDVKRTISEMTNAYKLQENQMANQIKTNQKYFDSIIESLKKQLDVQDKFNLNEFSNSIQSIISDLDKLDGNFGQGNFVESTLGTRTDLEDYKSKILDIANAVSAYQNNLSSPTQGSIQDEIAFVNGLKTKIDSLNDSLNNTELQYKNEEAALQNLIDTQSKYYDDQIKAQQEALDKLDEQIEKEDRLKKLKDINDQIDKAKADKRFSYIDANGNETLTYDKSLVKDLESQRDDLVKQYEREDLKNAIQDQIDALEKAKKETIDKLQEQLDKTKQIHQSDLEAQRLYIQSLQNLYQISVNDVNSKIDKLKTSYDNEISNEQDRLTQLQAVHQQELDSMNLYASYLSSLNSFLVQDTQNKIEALKPLYAQEQQDLQNHVDALNLTTEEGSKRFGQLVDEWNKNAVIKLDSMVSNANSRLAQMQAIMAAMAAMSGGGGSSSSSSSGAEFMSIGKYHTGGTVGQPPLQEGEVPAILKKGEDVFTRMQSLKLEDIIVKPLSYLSSLASKIKLPNIQPNVRGAYGSSVAYNLSNFTIQANNPTELFEGIKDLVKSQRI